MNMELMMQYVTYGLMALGALYFLVAVIVQVIKELPGLNKIPTSIVALVVSVIVCQLAVVIVCQCLKIVIVWYYVTAAFIAAFVVYVIATGGWERAAEIWSRTKYKNSK